MLSIKPRKSSDMLSVALLRQLWKVGRKWWPLGWFLKLLYYIATFVWLNCGCSMLKKVPYRKQYSHPGRTVQPREMPPVNGGEFSLAGSARKH